MSRCPGYTSQYAEVDGISMMTFRYIMNTYSCYIYIYIYICIVYTVLGGTLILEKSCFLSGLINVVMIMRVHIINVKYC